jgi:hypothetical protein
MVGPPGSGKSTFAKKNYPGFVYVNQDSQGVDHLHHFDMALIDGQDLIVDRMGFNKEQRSRYLKRAKEFGYETKIVVLHENFDTCRERCTLRSDHETIKDKETASKAINFFFSKYERVEDSEADKVERYWPTGDKPKAIVCDLDGTLCNLDHRLHFVKGERKNWGAFFKHLDKDEPNEWCAELLKQMANGNYAVVYCSGRPDSYKEATDKWLRANDLKFFHVGDCHDYMAPLYMRNRGDHRDDSIVKEILLDFEILTRFTPYFMIDDRKRVVDMWRKRGYIVLQCAEGNF